jgi:hypothetical protein
MIPITVTGTSILSYPNNTSRPAARIGPVRPCLRLRPFLPCSCNVPPHFSPAPVWLGPSWMDADETRPGRLSLSMSTPAIRVRAPAPPAPRPSGVQAPAPPAPPLRRLAPRVLTPLRRPAPPRVLPPLRHRRNSSVDNTVARAVWLR